MKEFLIEQTQTYRVKVRGEEQDAIYEIENGNAELEDVNYSTLEETDIPEVYLVDCVVRVNAMNEDDAIEATNTILRTHEGDTLYNFSQFEFLDADVNDARPEED